jgi:hypothetical protein
MHGETGRTAKRKIPSKGSRKRSGSEKDGKKNEVAGHRLRRGKCSSSSTLPVEKKAE